jgi:5-methylcytosine-specific restriction protein A
VIYPDTAAGGGGLQAAISGPLPEEVVEAPALFEGAVCRVSVNAYERDPEARRRCIEAHGTSCCICGFSFCAVYGEAAEGYIHVHHLRPLSEVGGEYVIDPVEDLRPVCPNCHAMLHLGGRCRSIEEVRQLMENAKADMQPKRP